MSPHLVFLPSASSDRAVDESARWRGGGRMAGTGAGESGESLFRVPPAVPCPPLLGSAPADEEGAVWVLGGMMKEPPWGVKSAYGRVTPPVGSLNPINRNISRFRKI